MSGCCVARPSIRWAVSMVRHIGLARTLVAGSLSARTYWPMAVAAFFPAANSKRWLPQSP